VRILVVTPTIPWPEVTGLRIRIANTIRALSSIGVVDVFAIGAEDSEVPTYGAVARLGGAARPEDSRHPISRLNQLTSRRLSIETRDYASLREAFLEWIRPPYDVTWFARAESFVALGKAVASPAVVDLDDLEDRRIATRLRATSRDAWLALQGNRGEHSGPRAWTSRLRAGTKLRRWRDLERSIADSVDAVTVCSELDRIRLGAPNAIVIPNGYAPPAEPVGHVRVGSPPTIVFPGLFGYAPNLDGAFYLVREVLPRLRALVPEVRVRLVGRYDDRMGELASLPGVTLTGQVPEMAPELALADIVAVPVRFGSGTRVKILEAFAHRIPVVSTGIGSEGLDAIDDEHLLVQDDPDEFATACARLLSDQELRQRLVDSAHELYWERYSLDAITPRIAELACRVAHHGP
jgi:glycosyltransferase involved in cell wall biosynthesis